MFDLPEDELQMLALALFVPDGQNTNGGFEYANFGDAGTSVPQQGRRSRVDCQRGDFGNGIPTGRAYS